MTFVGKFSLVILLFVTKFTKSIKFETQNLTTASKLTQKFDFNHSNITQKALSFPRYLDLFNSYTDF